MTQSNINWLARLGAGESIESVCRLLGITRAEFDERWRKEAESRVPKASGWQSVSGLNGPVEIARDRWNIPHVYAESNSDLYFGFGFAQAQDRLFQLDYLRRKGMGRLAEILGTVGLPFDLVARTVGLNRIAAAEWERLPAETRDMLEAFAAGVNAFIETCEALPIEFSLLDFRPEPWTPLDSLAIESEFRWYLTGRFPIIVMPELAKRRLGEGPLYQEFILAENDTEPILHVGEYAPRGAAAGMSLEPVGYAVNEPEAIGSNNWVVAGLRTTTGLPLVASDPHIAMEAVSCWYEAHLCGGSYNVAGMGYAGMPAIMFGRNESVAWGITNNICSLRDLYHERTNPAHPGCFKFDGTWEKSRELVETIHVRGAASITKTIRFSRNGPIVDEILPPVAKDTGPVSLKWLGSYHGGWLTALLDMGRASTVAEFREALRPWHVPTFSLVFADVEGQIGFHAAGRIPVRRSLCRSYRPGWDPEHQWQGLIPFEEMPHVLDPPRGWVATANNRVAADDFPHLLHGCWASGWRGTRIREMIESEPKHSANSMIAMQHDTKSLRAQDLVPHLLAALAGTNDSQVRAATDLLAAWDFFIETESAATAIFNVFFTNWCQAVAAERFEPAEAELLAGGMLGCASRLLKADPAGWFAPGVRAERIIETFRRTLDLLTERFGPEPEKWQWGDLHVTPLAHPLSFRGDLGKLLDQPRGGVRGDMVTVNNTGSGPDWCANSGAGYRLVADLASSPPALLAVDGQSHSGHVGSPHYRDQFADWHAENYHEISLDRQEAAKSAVNRLVIEPDE